MRQLPIHETLRDHADDLAAGGERRLSDGAHQPDPPAAVHEPDAALRETLPDVARRGHVARLVAGAGTAEHADAHGQKPSAAR